MAFGVCGGARGSAFISLSFLDYAPHASSVKAFRLNDNEATTPLRPCTDEGRARSRELNRRAITPLASALTRDAGGMLQL